MRRKIDWFPAARADILAMAVIRIIVCNLKRTLWGIAGVALTELAELKDAAQALIEDASTRTAAKRLCLLAWSLAA
jgi:hypothetical protein